MNSKDKGTFAEAQAIAYYISLGYEVSLPLGDRRPYDLIVDKGGELVRVQVKFTSNPQLSLRISGGNRSFHTHKKYDEGSYDELFIWFDGSGYIYPALFGRNALTVDAEHAVGTAGSL